MSQILAAIRNTGKSTLSSLYNTTITTNETDILLAHLKNEITLRI
jgi:hypothetical protein